MSTNSLPAAPDWSHVSLPEGERSLPVYLLLDTSGSMSGQPLESLKRGLAKFQKELADDEQTRQIVKIGVIAFNSHAEMLTSGLVRVGDLTVPELQTGGGTCLSAALALLRESLCRDVTKPVKGGRKGDWKPMVYIFTDGQPTDGENWKHERAKVLDRTLGHLVPSTVVVVGCGENAKDETLKEISTGPAFRADTDEASFVALFQFLSASVQHSLQRSQNLGQAQQDPMANLPVSQCIQRIA